MKQPRKPRAHIGHHPLGPPVVVPDPLGPQTPGRAVVSLVADTFSFLVGHGFGPPLPCACGEQVSVVFQRGHVEIMVATEGDAGWDPPDVRVLDGASGGQFGVDEARAAMTGLPAIPRPRRGEQRLAFAALASALDDEARFVREHLDDLLEPSAELLEAIERRRDGLRAAFGRPR